MRISFISITLALTLLQLVAGAPVEHDEYQVRALTGSNKKPTTTATPTGKSTTPTSTSTSSSSTPSSSTTSTPKTSTGSSTSANPTSSSTSQSSCPALTSILGSGSKSKRAGVTHPPGKSNVVLFHGTESSNDAKTLESTVKLEVIKDGDLHSTAIAGVDGGFYLTDSLLAAAQFACRKLEPIAYVLEYQWGGASLPVKDYQAGPDYDKFLNYEKHADATNRDPALDKIMQDNAMISGPMNAPGDDHLSDDFWQYAVIKQDAATKNLKYVKTYQIACDAVPIGNGVQGPIYESGQRSNSKFDQMVQLLGQCKPGNGSNDWKKAVKG